MSRMNEMCGDAGVWPLLVLEPRQSARTPNTTRDHGLTDILALLRSPRLRCLAILMKSSRKPTGPQPTNRNSSSSADADGASG